MTMNDQQLLRYSRQIMLDDIDIEGQEKLLAARVLVVGLGGLGSPLALYLAGAGVGHLILADFDQVDLTNLQRQIIHNTDSIDQLKAESAATRLRALNPDVKLTLVTEPLNRDSLTKYIKDVDVLVDCTDNFAIRFALNSISVEHHIPLVSGAAIRLEGQVAVFDPRLPDSPCYRCLYEPTEDDTSCTANGVIAPLVGIIGAWQALEVMRLITALGDSTAGRVQIFDARSARWRSYKLPKDPGCPVCGTRHPEEAICNSRVVL